MLDSLEQLLDQDRNLVLVGHGFSEDLLVLISLGFDLKTSVVGLADLRNRYKSCVID
jgi:hypothetical protein